MTAENKSTIALANASDFFAACTDLRNAVRVRREREEREFRDMQCWGPLLSHSQYRLMKDRVDRFMLTTPEDQALTALVSAYNLSVIARETAK